MTQCFSIFLCAALVSGFCSCCPERGPSNEPKNLKNSRGEDLINPSELFSERWGQLPVNFSWKGPTDSNFVFEHYFTWRVYGETVGAFPNYEVHLDPERAVYVFDRVEVGEGLAGFHALLERLNTLPSGSRIVLYPDYAQTGQSMPLGFPFGWKMQFPYQAHQRQLEETVIQRHLNLIGSSNPSIIKVWEEKHQAGSTKPGAPGL